MNWQDILKLTPVSKTPIARLVGAAIADAGTVTPDEDATLNKAPPIRNPRADEFKDMPNEDLTMDEYEKLFEEIVDPVIEKAARKKEKYAYIRLDKLGMSSRKAVKIAKKLYKDMDYGNIFAMDGEELTFRLYLT